jgi:hypothetical protein
MLISVLGRSLSAKVKAGIRAAVTAHAAYGRRNGIALQFATIDGRFTATSKAPFEQASMRALFAPWRATRPRRRGVRGDPPGAPGGATMAERWTARNYASIAA